MVIGRKVVFQGHSRMAESVTVLQDSLLPDLWTGSLPTRPLTSAIGHSHRPAEACLRDTPTPVLGRSTGPQAYDKFANFNLVSDQISSLRLVWCLDQICPGGVSLQRSEAPLSVSP